MSAEVAPYDSLRHKVASACGAVAVSVGLLVLVGWAADIPALESVLPGLATMKANAALAFVLAGLSLWGLLAKGQAGPRFRVVGLWSAVAVFAVASLTLVQYSFSLDLGIDQLLFRDSPGSVATSSPGRMASIAAFVFLLIGAALLLLHTGRAPLVAQAFSGVAIFVSYLCCLTYLYGTDYLHIAAPFSSVALHTAVTLLLLSSGILAASPSRGAVGMLVSDGVDGVVVRRMLPVVLLAPVLVGWLQLAGQRAELFDTACGVALLTLSNILIFATFLFGTASLLQQYEAKRTLADGSLRESEARNRAILETSLDCIIAMDHEGKVVEFNPAAEATFGYRREQVMGRELADLIIPQSLREAHRKGLARYLATGEAPVLGKRLELSALRADGSEFPVELAITRIPTEGPPLFTAYLRDIGKRTRLERQRNARLAVNQVLSQVASVEEAATGVLQAICENVGWDVGFVWKRERQGKALHCLASWHQPGVTTAEFEAVSRRRTFRKGEGLPGRIWATSRPSWVLDIRHDSNFPRHDAAVQEGLHAGFGCPIVLIDETLGAIEFFSRQIQAADPDLMEMVNTAAGQIGQFMERMEAEEALRQQAEEVLRLQEERFHIAFHHAPIGMALVALDGRWLRANRSLCEIVGYSEAELLASDFQAVTHPDDLEADLGHVRDMMEDTIRTYQMEKRYIHKQGHVVHVLLAVSLVRDGDGEPLYFIAQIQNITLRKLVEAQMKASLQEKEVLLKEIHHRVKNNLQIVSTLLDLQSDHTQDRKAIEMFKESRGRVKSMALIHERLYRAHDVARVDFDEYVRQLAEDLYHAYGVSSDEIVLHVEVAVPPLPIDIAIPCGLLLNELISNCFKHAFADASEGWLRVTLHRDGPNIALTVADNGGGFPPGFDFRNTASFGLQLVNILVEQLHGEIELNADRGGSEFVVTFPMTDSDPHGADR